MKEFIEALILGILMFVLPAIVYILKTGGL